MTDADILLKAIIANPTDDLPRLQYAAWLEDQGDSAKADFIRASIIKGHDNAQGEFGAVNKSYPPSTEWEAWGLPAGWSMTCYRKLFELRSDLLQERRIGPGTALLVRGFVEEIACPWEDWSRHADAITARHPVRRVRLTKLPERLDAAFWFTLQSWPCIRFELFCMTFELPPPLDDLPILMDTPD